MSDVDVGSELDIDISGPGDELEPLEPEIQVYHAYRIDFEDTTSREYVAQDIIAAIFLAQFDKPDIVIVQVARIRKDALFRRIDPPREGTSDEVPLDSSSAEDTP
jgi:hypothetical protein